MGVTARWIRQDLVTSRVWEGRGEEGEQTAQPALQSAVGGWVEVVPSTERADTREEE